MQVFKLFVRNGKKMFWRLFGFAARSDISAGLFLIYLDDVVLLHLQLFWSFVVVDPTSVELKPTIFNYFSMFATLRENKLERFPLA